MDNLLAHPINVLFIIPTFFTSWSLILVIFHYYTHAYFHLLLLTSIVALGGLYVSNINPRGYYIPVNDDETVVITNTYLIDAILHIAPFVFVCWKYGSYYMQSCHYTAIANVIVLGIVYLACVDGTSKYKITNQEERILLCIAVAIVIGISLSCRV